MRFTSKFLRHAIASNERLLTPPTAKYRTKYGTMSNVTVTLIGSLCLQTIEAHGHIRMVAPSHELRGFQLTQSCRDATLKWLHNTTCDQVIEYQSNQQTTVDALALTNSVPSAALLHLNLLRADHVESGSYCAPSSCQVTVIGGENPTSANNFVQDHGNMSLTQFWAWNMYMDPSNMRPDEVVCVGYFWESCR